MIIHIEAFTHASGNDIPKKYTCDGEEVSPGVSWSDVPEETKSFALIMQALDVEHRSNPLVLWVVYNIPGDIRKIITGTIPINSHVGINDRGKKGYSAPCPEPSKIHHRYEFELYALDKELFLPDQDVDKSVLLKAMKDHILKKAVTYGTYERHKK